MLPYALFTAFLRRLDPEIAHNLALGALRSGLLPAPSDEHDPILAIQLWQKSLSNPVGLAAGFDKDGVAMAALLGFGFGFVEVGSVTPKPQPGNPKPRLFRLSEDAAVINRFGFNSEGHAAVEKRLERFRRNSGSALGLLGVNLGKNKESPDAAADYAAGAARFAAYADYLVINVSSPNTPGLRSLQDENLLTELVAAVRAALSGLGTKPPPLVIKLAPDLEPAQREALAAVALEQQVDGIILSNTTLARPESLASRHREEAGGLSGQPLFESSTAVLRDFHRLTGGRIPLIGTGGVASGAQAYAKIRAGASLVQLYTGLVYEGPGLVKHIKSELAALLRRDGFASVAEAVGTEGD